MSAAVAEGVEIDLTFCNRGPAFQVILLLDEFPSVLLKCRRSGHCPAVILVNYLNRLSHAVSSVYSDLRVKNQPASVSHGRLLFFARTCEIISFGFRLLGLPAVEEM